MSFSPPASTGGSKGGGGARTVLTLLLVVALIAAAGIAIWLGRSGSLFGGGDENGNGGGFGSSTTTVRGIIGSEKREFFNDPEVQRILADHGYTVEIDTAGSRLIAERDLSAYDFAFPSSAPAADRITAQVDSRATYAPFSSPMAIASFVPVAELLEAENITRRDANGTWYFDMQNYLNYSNSGTRWRDLPGADSIFPSPRVIQISTTDVRTSNSAGMYLAMLSWVTNGGAVVTNQGEVDRAVEEVANQFIGQGYTESTSAGPFADYLGQGMGSKPLVMIYEAQFLGRLMSDTQAHTLSDDMVLLYPEPTVYSKHIMIALTEEGDAVSRLINDDPELQKLAALYGFRPRSTAVFTEVLAEHNVPAPPAVVNSIDPPSYDHLEALISGVETRFHSAGLPSTPVEPDIDPDDDSIRDN